MIRVLHFVSKMDRAGQETFIMNVYRHLDRRSIQFNFLCSDSTPGDFDPEISALGGKMFCLPAARRTGGLGRYWDEIGVIAAWLRGHRADYDIIHIHTYHALDVFVHLEAARQAGVQNIVIHSHNTSGPHPAVHRVFRWINSLYSFESAACSAEAGEWLFGRRRVRRGKVRVIYNGIDVKRFAFDPTAADQVKKELGLAGETVVGHVGRFNRQKNHEFLIRVFEEYARIDPASVLLLIGKGELLEEVKAQVDALGLTGRVKFLGSRDDIPRLMSAMDVFLFPSLFEGLPVVLAEAQASGLKCLTPDRIPPREGVIVPELLFHKRLKAPAAEWAKALDAAISADSVERDRANEIVADSKFNIVSAAKEVEALYMELAGRNGRKS